MIKDNELRLYHRNVFWNDWFDEQSKKIVENTNQLHPHLEQRLTETDRSHGYNIVGLWMAFKAIKEMEEIKPFEVGTDLSGNVLKCVVRASYNDKQDICIVFRRRDRQSDEYYLKTAWLLNKNDSHKTLDKTKYCTK